MKKREPTLSDVAKIVEMEEKSRASRSSLLSSVSQLDDLMKNLNSGSILSESAVSTPEISFETDNSPGEEEIEILENRTVLFRKKKAEEEDEGEEEEGDELEGEGEDEFGSDLWVGSPVEPRKDLPSPGRLNLFERSSDPYATPEGRSPTAYNPEIRSTVEGLKNLTFIELEPDDTIPDKFTPTTMEDDESTSQEGEEEENKWELVKKLVFSKKKKDKKEQAKEKKKRGSLVNPWCCLVFFGYMTTIWFTFLINLSISALLVVRSTYFDEDEEFSELESIFKLSFSSLNVVFVCHGFLTQLVVTMNFLCRPTVYSNQIRRSMKSVVHHTILCAMVLVYFVFSFGFSGVMHFFYYPMMAYVGIPVEIIIMCISTCMSLVVYKCCLCCCELGIRQIIKSRSNQNEGKIGKKEQKKRISKEQKKHKEISGIGKGNVDDGEYQFQAVYRVKEPHFSDI